MDLGIFVSLGLFFFVCASVVLWDSGSVGFGSSGLWVILLGPMDLWGFGYLGIRCVLFGHWAFGFHGSLGLWD